MKQRTLFFMVLGVFEYIYCKKSYGLFFITINKKL